MVQIIGFCMVVVWLLYGCCMVVVWLLYGLVLGNSTRQRVNHPVACPCAGRAHGGSRRERSPRAVYLRLRAGAVCERALDAAEVGQRRRVGEAGAVDVVAAVCVAVAGLA